MKTIIIHPHFNSELIFDEDFAYLNLNVNTHFNFVNASVLFDPKRWLEQPDWTEKMKKDFIDNYKSAITRVWNHKIWLSSNAPWGTSDFENKFNKGIPIICGINIIPKKHDLSNIHQELKVLNRKPNISDPGLAWMNGVGSGEGTLMIDSNDLVIGERTSDHKHVERINSVHEFGHFLGLDHVGTHSTKEKIQKLMKSKNIRKIFDDLRNGKLKCMTDVNDAICYEGDDVMGNTSLTINKWHARPWIQRIKKHLENSRSNLVFTANLGSPPYSVELQVGPDK